MKKIKGFTLIELIVVIAIIAVLCAIIIPSVMSYVTKSRIATSNSNAKEIYTELQGLFTEYDGKGVKIDGTIMFNAGVPDLSNSTISSSDSELTTKCQVDLELVDEKFTDSKDCSWASKITDGEIDCVVYSNRAVTYVGGFPVQCPQEKEYKMKGGSITDYCDCAYENGTSWKEKSGK